MTTREYLSQTERIDRMVQNKLSEIYQLKTMACSITVANNGERVQTSTDKDRLGKTIAKIVDLEKETDELVDNLLAKRLKIIEQVQSMDDTNYYHVLFNRYIVHKGWQQIADELGYTVRNTTILHGKALKQFEKMYGNEYLS